MPGTKKPPAETASPDGTGAASAFGGGQTGEKPPEAAEPTFTIPGAYGRPSQSFTPGEGRLARPRFRYTASVSFGYDDNVFQTPTNSPGIPTQVVQVLDTPPTPDQVVQGIGPNGEATVVVVPGRPATTRKVVIPGIPGQPRVGSFLNHPSASFDVQFASRKTLFTFDLNAGANMYWDRPGKDVDYTGSMALLYLHRLTKRLQFTANVVAAYQTQPNLSLINTSTQQGGSYLNVTSSMNLNYRFTPRFSGSATLNYNILRYQEELQQSSDYNETVLGTELRYLFSPRYTLLAQLRYSRINYVTTDGRDADTIFLLLGGEVTLSRRFTGSLLFGGTLRTFNNSGNRATSPYLEMTLSYQLARATLIRFNGRFGFEAPPDEQSDLISLRSGLTLVHSFSPRLQANVGLDYVRQTTTTQGVDTSSVTNTIQLSLGMAYNLTRQWTLSANYNYIAQRSTISTSDYYRNQTFIAAAYEF